MFGISRLEFYGVAAAVIIAIAISYAYLWENSIKKAALAEFNNQQLQQQVKDQQDYIAKMNEVNILQKKSIEDLKSENAKLSGKLADLNKYLDSEAAKQSDKDSSEVLKKTLGEIINSDKESTR
jgi:hypothetical protein